MIQNMGFKMFIKIYRSSTNPVKLKNSMKMEQQLFAWLFTCNFENQALYGFSGFMP